MRAASWCGFLVSEFLGGCMSGPKNGQLETVDEDKTAAVRLVELDIDLADCATLLAFGGELVVSIADGYGVVVVDGSQRFLNGFPLRSSKTWRRLAVANFFDARAYVTGVIFITL